MDIPTSPDIHAVLEQMRALKARIQQPSSVEPPQAPASAAVKPGFQEIFSQYIEQVNAAQQHASELQRAFEMDPKQLDLAEVMVAMGKAQVHFQAVTQVRNRLLSAYQEIMSMSV